MILDVLYMILEKKAYWLSYFWTSKWCSWDIILFNHKYFEIVGHLAVKLWCRQSHLWVSQKYIYFYNLNYVESSEYVRIDPLLYNNKNKLIVYDFLPKSGQSTFLKISTHKSNFKIYKNASFCNLTLKVLWKRSIMFQKFEKSYLLILRLWSM